MAERLTTEREAEIHRDLERVADSLACEKLWNDDSLLRDGYRELKDELTALRAELATALDRVNEAERKAKALDWVESTGRATTRNMFDQDGGFLVSNEGDVLAGTIDAGYVHLTLLEAIEAAAQAEKRVRELEGK